MQPTNIAIICAGLALAPTLVATPQPGAVDEVAKAAQLRQDELAEIAELLRTPDARGYVGGVHRLVHLASRYPQLPDEVRSRLVRVTSGPDRNLAAFAERALYAFDHPPESEPGVSEEALYLRARRQDFERARDELAGLGPDAGAAGRMAAVNTLVHLLSTSPPDLSEQVMLALGQVKDDWLGRRGGLRQGRPLQNPGSHAGDLEADLSFVSAALAERALAAHDGRPIETAFVPEGHDPVRDSGPAGLRPDDFAMLADDSPGRRLLAMELLIERAQNDDLTGSDHELTVAAFEILTEDSDPRVAGRARFALAGFAGDEHAWGNVYVGEVQAGPSGAPQPATPAAPGPANVGELDENGVFIGVARATAEAVPLP